MDYLFIILFILGVLSGIMSVVGLAFWCISKDTPGYPSQSTLPYPWQFKIALGSSLLIMFFSITLELESKNIISQDLTILILIMPVLGYMILDSKIINKFQKKI